MSYIYPRSKKTFTNRNHFIQQQIHAQSQRQETSNSSNKDSKLKRTAITIDSRHRLQEYTPVSLPLLHKTITIMPEGIIRDIKDSNNTIEAYELELRYPVNNNIISELNLSTQDLVIIRSIQPIINDTFLSIPKSVILFNKRTGSPKHLITDISIVNNEAIVKIRIQNYIYDSEIPDTNPITLTGIDIIRVEEIHAGFPNPNNYMIHLNRTYTNVVAIRLLNTVIPNTSYMINTSSPKNNKLRWINKSSKISLYSHYPVLTSENSISWIKINHAENIHFITDRKSISDPISYINNTVHEYNGDDIIYKTTHYQIQNTTLLGGQYTAVTISEELEKQLNDTSDLEKSQSHFCTYSSQLATYSSSESFSNTYQNEHSKHGRFFITINDNRKFIEFSQCEKVFWNNRKKIYNDTIINEAGPCIVNEGFGWLYIKHPGHDFVSGDVIRIANSFDIANIKSHEINTEHTIFVGDVYKMSLSNINQNPITYSQVHLFDIIVNKDNIGIKSDELLFGRIIQKYSSNENITDPIISHLHIELCFHDKGRSQILDTNTNWYSSLHDTTFTFSSIEKLDNAQYGYACKLSTIPNTSFLDGVGNSKLFIGKPIEFSLLMGMPESPKQVLGFESNIQGDGNTAIEFSTHISNTVKINKAHIISSYLLPNHAYSTYYNIIIQCRTELNFSSGDYIYVKQHMIHGEHMHKEHSHYIGITNKTSSTVVVKQYIPSNGAEHFNLPQSKKYVQYTPMSNTGYFIYNDIKYKDTGTISSSGLIDGYYTINTLGNSFDRMKYARVALSYMKVSSIKITNNIVTLTLSEDTIQYFSCGTFWIYFMDMSTDTNTNTTIPNGYYEVQSNINAIDDNNDNTITFVVPSPTLVDILSFDTNINIKIRIITDPYRNIINSQHIVQEILPDENGKNTRILISINKNYCNFLNTSTETMPTSLYIGMLREQRPKLDDTTCIKLGSAGCIFMKEIDKPYTLQNNYLYLICPTFDTTLQTSSAFNQENIFAKIMLPGTNGEYVFNTFISHPKVFSSHPLRSLNKLHFKFINEEGELYNFNEMDHSFVLEITELNERLSYLNISSGTVQI